MQRELTQVTRASPAGLDVGCGSFRFGLLLSRALRSAGGTLLAVDINPRMLAAAREVARRAAADNVSFVLADYLSNPGSERADLVFVSEVLQLVPEPQRLLRNVYADLRSGGRLILRTPSHDQIRRVIWMAAFPTALALDLARTIDRPELENMLARDGFRVQIHEEVDETKTVPSASLLSCLKGRAYSILRLISSDEFEVGIVRMRKMLSGVSRIADTRSLTCYVATKE